MLQLGKPVDVLINNAGIMFGPRKETSEVSLLKICNFFLMLEIR